MASAGGSAGLIDTDILIDAERGIAGGVAFVISQQASFGVQVSVISAMELIAGSRNAAELTRIQQFLAHIRVLPVSVVSSQEARQLMESFFLSHGLLIPDALIAATALEHGLVLHTKNVRHFQMIPNLQAVRPY